MRIGLVTITHGQNYGNRLQNYAIQKLFEDKGHIIETIRHPYYGFNVRVLAGIEVKKILNYKYTKIPKRIRKFTKFNKKYMKFSKLYIQSGDVDKKISSSYDVFICGSDQIWNPRYFEEKDSYFLSFVKGKKKIALSASFGLDEIEKEEDRIRISERLKELTAISVREKSGQKIVKELSGRKAVLVIDPTLYLSPDKWMEIESKPIGVEANEYVLFYLLGTYKAEYVENLKQLFINKGKKIVLLENEYQNLGTTTDEEFSMDPSEFVWLIRNSQMVVTDSFHAVAFSLQFKKEIKIVVRDTLEGDISSRIVNLVDMFQIQNPYYEEGQELIPATVDYEYVGKVLKEERKKFMDFIDSNL